MQYEILLSEQKRGVSTFIHKGQLSPCPSTEL